MVNRNERFMVVVGIFYGYTDIEVKKNAPPDK